MDKTCCICGPVRNCEPFLDKVFSNILKITTLFKKYEIVIFYDESSDASLKKLKQYQKKIPFLKVYKNVRPLLRHRTHNIAYARNFLLNYVKTNNPGFDYFIMMDMDDVNAKECNPDILNGFLTRTDWDGLSFNTTPKYYDIWALSIKPFYFSYNHFNNNDKFHNIIANYVDTLLKNTPYDGLLCCLSSFNGFSIYRTSKFLNTKYDGFPRPNLFPDKILSKQKKIMHSELVYKKYTTVDGRFEDCEHRMFHMNAVLKDDARIRISPKVLFS
jgi:hypothetical protein